jgi:hypothetical protein
MSKEENLCQCEIHLERQKKTKEPYQCFLMCSCGLSFKIVGSYHRHIKHCWQYSMNNPCKKMFPSIKKGS